MLIPRTRGNRRAPWPNQSILKTASLLSAARAAWCACMTWALVALSGCSQASSPDRLSTTSSRPAPAGQNPESPNTPQGPALLASADPDLAGRFHEAGHGAYEKDGDRDAEEENEEAEQTFAYESALFRYRQRLNADGSLPANPLMTAKRQRDAMLAAQAHPRDGGLSSGSWEWLGPGNVGGRIRSILIHPGDPRILWVGSASGGIWKTTNGGTSWRPLDDFLASLAVNCMAIDPADPDVLYAGTGEGFLCCLNRTTNIAATQGAGVFKSSDGGDTWTQLDDTKTWTYVNRLAVDPSDGRNLLAATSTGLFRSQDGGQNWDPTTLLGRVDDVRFDPTNGNLAIASRPTGSISYSTTGGTTWQPANILSPPASGSVTVASATDGDVLPDFLSVTNAADFSPGDGLTVGTGASLEFATVQAPPPPPAPAPPPGAIVVSDLQQAHPIGNPVSSNVGGRVELAYAPGSTNIVYASMDVGGGSLFKSIDGGQNYTLAHGSLYPDYLGGQGFYDNALWVDPTNANVVILGGVGLSRTIDGGPTLTPIDGAVDGTGIHADHHVIVHHPSYNGASNTTVFFGNDGGIYRTDDALGGPTPASWIPMNNNLGITQFYGGAVRAAAGVIVGGTQDNGSLRYNGTANTWSSWFGGDGGLCAADPDDPNYFYGEYVNGRIFRSTDGAASAGYIHGPTTNGNGDCPANPPAGTITDACTGAANFISPILLDPNESQRMYVGVARLWRTNDVKAETPFWTSINDSVSAAAGNLSVITVAEGSSNLIWTGHNNGDLYKTTNGLNAAPTWTLMDDPATPLPNRYCSSITLDRHDPDWVYATFMGYASDNVWRSRDSGRSWKRITGPQQPGQPTDPRHLPNIPVSSLAIHPGRPGWLYVGTDLGIFASEDDGLTWSAVNDGPANVIVDQLLTQDADTLLAFSFGRGVYRANLPASVDCDSDGIDDLQELTEALAQDCNTNRMPDNCDVFRGASQDCNFDFIPDDCQADCDGDGTPDVCEAFIFNDCDADGVQDDCELRSSRFLLGQPETRIEAGPSPVAVVIANITGSGYPDIVSANGAPPSAQEGVSVRRNWGGWFESRQVFPLPEPALALTAGDVDGDLDNDVVVTHWSGTAGSFVSVLINRGSSASFWLGFQDRATYETGGNIPQAVALGDLNRDGALDIAVTNFGSRSVGVLLNSGSGTFGPAAPLEVGLVPTAVAIADLDGDGKNDVIVANTGADTVSLLRGNGNGTFQPNQEFPAGDGVRALVPIDLDTDGDLDLVLANANANNLSYLVNAGRIGPGWLGMTPDDGPLTGVEPTALVITDLSGDGRPDVAVANAAGDSVSLFSGRGGFNVALNQTIPIGRTPLSIAAGDLNGDGFTDLAAADFDEGQLSLLMNRSYLEATDCDSNGLLDECDPDCDADGAPDPCEFPASGLAHWWTLDADATDRIGDTHGALLGGVSLTGGRIGQALHFDGIDAAVDFGAAAGNFGAAPFTIAFWLRTDTTGRQALLGKRQVCTPRNDWRIYLNDSGALAVEFGYDGAVGYMIGTTPVNDGRYHFVTVLRETGRSALHVDGRAESIGFPVSVANLENDGPLFAGASPCRDTDRSAFFNGDLDEIVFLDTALTNDQARVLFRAGGIQRDCNGNGLPDSCDVGNQTGVESCRFPNVVPSNTTGVPDYIFVGRPDNEARGIAANQITFQFDCGVVVNGPGPDLNVYEQPSGSPEFQWIDVLVSDDGTNFATVKSSEAPAVPLYGDGAHPDPSYVRSYDLAVANRGTARFLRIQGTYVGGDAIPYRGMDLDAVGAVYILGQDCDDDGILDSCEIAAGSTADCDADGLPDACRAKFDVRIGDRDDFDNADGDDVPDLLGGEIIGYPGFGYGGPPEGPTDTVLIAGRSDYTFVFDVPRGRYAEASLVAAILDPDGSPGWNAVPILLDGEDSGLRITAAPFTPGLDFAFTRLEYFPLAADQLALLSDGRLTVTFPATAGLQADDAVFDYLELHYLLADCNGNGSLDACDVASGASPDADSNGIPDECEGPAGDLDGDGDTDEMDARILTGVLLGSDSDPDHVRRADLTADGLVNALDIPPFIQSILNP